MSAAQTAVKAKATKRANEIVRLLAMMVNRKKMGWDGCGDGMVGWGRIVYVADWVLVLVAEEMTWL